MTQPRWDDDMQLLVDLRQAMFDPGPVPPEFNIAGRAALQWLGIDIDLALAELTFDSVSDVELATRATAVSASRIVAFHGAGVSVEMELVDGSITGQISPADRCRISCQIATGTFDEAAIDAVGCFVLRAPSKGPIRLLLSYSHRRNVATNWVQIFSN